MKAGYGKAGKQKTLSNFPTATTTTNYNYLWDTDSEGKVNLPETQIDLNRPMSPIRGDVKKKVSPFLPEGDEPLLSLASSPISSRRSFSPHILEAGP
jgi:hypothetical protein